MRTDAGAARHEGVDVTVAFHGLTPLIQDGFGLCFQHR